MAGVSEPDRQESQMGNHSSPATPRQLHYLRVLADRTGTTFANPKTSGEASREIRRLERLPSLTRSTRRRERRDLDADRDRLKPSSSVGSDEVTGYGSNATWANRD
jgi:hypothetical protein